MSKFLLIHITENTSMALNVKIAVLFFFIFTLTGCGGGGSKMDSGSSPDPDTLSAETDNSGQETKLSEPETPTNVSDISITEPDETENSKTPSSPETNTPEDSLPEGNIDNPTIVTLPETNGAVIVKNQKEAALFLNRSTFGPTETDITNLISKDTYENWLEDQFNMSPTYHLPEVKSLASKMCSDRNDEGQFVVDSWEIQFPRHQVWWETAVSAEDQFRSSGS